MCAWRDSVLVDLQSLLLVHMTETVGVEREVTAFRAILIDALTVY
jgi:hypothetical protein